MTDTDKLINFVNEGALPPLPKGQRMDQLNPPTLPDESITWIGTVHSDPIMFMKVGSKYGIADVMVGISPYRIIFCGKPTLSNRVYSRSYWFEVDFEGTIWKRGTLRKKEYTGLVLSPPKYKKGVLSREIVLTNRSTRADGRQDKTFETTLSSLKWNNPHSGKFEGGKGDEFFKQIMYFYEQRQTVTLRTLLLLTSDPEALEEEMYSVAPPERRAIQVEEVASLTPVAKPVERPPVVVSTPAAKPELEKKPVTPPMVKPKAAKKPVPAPATTAVCPSCGKALKADARFCGNCGARFDEKDPVHAEKPEPKPSPAVALQPKAATPIKKVQPAGTPPATACPSCGKPLKPGAKFCGSCGARFDEIQVKPVKERKAKSPAVCPNCGKPVEIGWKGCPFCGQSLST
jgi:hypothetical protein